MTQNITYEDLYRAYLECRKNKRNTSNAIKFELDFESNLYTLLQEINKGVYKPNRSIAFIIKKPVTREIFAADFRDRVVHHLLIGKINHIFEKQFIYDSYSCRKGKGTHFGIQRVNKFIRQCSQNYTKNCYILKLDIQGFFMHINRNKLLCIVEQMLQKHYNFPDKQIVLNLCKIIITANPIENCTIKGNPSNWFNLPANKSLFHSKAGCGLPIGNLTSQVFANVYMNVFDHFMKNTLGIRYYGRYVDDFVIVHENKEFLKKLTPIAKEFLKKELGLDLHPHKIYLQHYSKGVQYLGAVIKPHRMYVQKRTKANVYDSICKHNKIVRARKPTIQEQRNFQSSINSYLGIIKKYKTYNLRKKIILKHISAYWKNYLYVSGGYAKFVMKKKYK
jgi:RNA-directed DNA polymerase